MPNLDVRSLLYEPELRIVGGVVVERRTSPTPNDFGEVRRAIPTSVVLDPVVIHNLSGRDLARLPEADRNTEHIRGYSLARVHVGDDCFEPDVVTYNARRWRVVRVEDYATQGGVYLWSAALIEDGAT